LICRLEEEDDTAVAGGVVDFKVKEVFYMPGFDGTGPAGMGPMTGWGRGYCNTSPATYYGPAPMFGQAYWVPGHGRGFGRGARFGWGRGFRRGLGPGFGRGRGYGRGFGWSGAYPAWGGW